MSIDEDVVACAPQDRLQQVFINLVENAIKYYATEKLVELVLENREQQVMIHLGDRGIGISLPHQNRIFERFYRVDESMTPSRDGTGLGLAIAKSLIEGMEGRIMLRSKAGEGCIFTITLPVWNPQLLAIAFSLLKMTLNWQSSSNLNLVLKDITSLSPQMDWMD